MASDRLKLPPSPNKRTLSPTRRLSSPFSEEKREDGYQILQKIQSPNKSYPGFLSSTGRATTSFPFSSEKRPDDVKTVKAKVRSTESLSGKGLLAADLIKNLQSQQTSVVQSSRAVSAKLHEKPAGLNAAQSKRPHSENSTRLLTPSAGNLGRRGSLPAPNLKQKSRAARDILKKYNVGNKCPENNLNEHGSDEGTLPSLRKVASANRLTTIHHDSDEEKEIHKPASRGSSKDLRMSAKHDQRRASINVSCDGMHRPPSSDKKRQTVHRPSKTLLQDKTDKAFTSESKVEKVQMPERKVCKMQSPQTKVQKVSMNKNKKKKGSKGSKVTITNCSDKSEESGTSSSSDSDSDDVKKSVKTKASQKEQTQKRNKNANKIEKDQLDAGDSSSEESGEEKEDASCVTSSTKKKKCFEKTNGDDSDKDEESESSDGEESESEKEERDDENLEKLKNKSNAVVTAIKDDNESESEDENNGSELNYDNLLVDEELAEFSKQITAPGMPAMDLLESHEKLLKENLIRHGKREKSVTEKKEEDNDDEVADDVEDLIDQIDDLIDADDEDIAYAKRVKKKSLKTKVKLMMAVSGISGKDRS